MKSWYYIATCIYNACMISVMAERAGIHIQPVMGFNGDDMAILLERRGIVGGWEIKGGVN